MTVNPPLSALTLIALLCGVTAAGAQSATPVEAVQPNGSISPPLALTQAQRGAIYNSVKRQRVHTSVGITSTTGAPVAPALELRNLPDLPDPPALGDDAGDFLKYATVEGDVIVVDPVLMRVVEVIHSGAGP